MKKAIIINQTDIETIIDSSNRLIFWAYEMSKLNEKCNFIFSIKLRFPHFGEINSGGMPIELCSQRVLELSLDELFE